MDYKERAKKIELYRLLYIVGLISTLASYVTGAVLSGLGFTVVGGIFLGLSIVLALGASASQVYAAVLESDQVYIDAGMTPPRLRKRHKTCKWHEDKILL